MPAFSLVFNKFQIEIPRRNLSLSVESSVSLQSFRRDTRTMKTRQHLDLLCSGKTWITRGIGCCIDFVFLVDGQLDGKAAMTKMIEEFACYVRDAPLWSDVSLHAELKFLERDTSRDSYPDFSIILKHPLPDWTSGHADSNMPSQAPNIEVPISVPCFQLRRVKVAMTFHFGTFCTIPPPLFPLATAVSSESGVGMKCKPKHELERLRNFQLLYKATPEDSQVAHSVSKLYFDSLPYHSQEKLGDKGSLPNIEFLSSVEIASPSNKSWPYIPSPPNSQEKETEENLTSRIIAPTLSDLSRIKETAHLAFCRLIGSRQNKSQAGTKVVLGRPTLTLSRLAPGLFSPGFTEAMSQRSKFIPTISHALAISLLRNAQSPNLRRKLLSLASISDEPHDSDEIEHFFQGGDTPSDSFSHSASRSLKGTIDGRLWTMLQNYLYHPPSTSQILQSQSLDTVSREAVTAGLISKQKDRQESVGGTTSESPSFPEYSSDLSSEDFEDLLANEGDYDEWQNYIDTDMIDRMTNDGFEDLLEGRPAYNGSGDSAEPHDTDFDMIADEGLGAWQRPEDVPAAYPVDDYLSLRNDISDIENEDMLI